MSYEHLRLERESPVTERHRPQDKRPRFKPDDPRAFGGELSLRLQQARSRLQEDIGGYDERRLLKIRIREGETLPNFEAIPGIKLVSQEEKTLVLAFATDEGLAEFESRLATLARDGTVTRKELLFVIEDFDHWTPEDRTGKALREQGYPGEEPFMLDVELWPQQRADQRDAMLDSFEAWLRREGMESLDTLKQPSLVMVRVRCNREQTETLLLNHRDVRTVDLPPRLGVTVNILRTDITGFPEPLPPPADAPAIGVLDSGLTTGHPLIAPAVGDAQGFVGPGREPEDKSPSGHGTFVSGLALYGDIAECIRSGRFVPQLRLFSGKVFKDDGTDQTEFVERAVERAVQELLDNYGCRIFNLSYGDLNKVYDGRHVRGLAYTLDRLSRELGVLFVVSAGNIPLHDLPDDVRDRYPEYLYEDCYRLLDPAPALNVLTVGGLALHTASRNAQRHPNSLEDVPVAQADQPSPITRCGPSINGAIKPDLVEHAGNIAIPRVGPPHHRGLGTVSCNSGFASGPAFCEDVGTSYAAPIVANKAARVLAEVPNASPHLIRSLLGAHAHWPQACEQLLNPDGKAEGRERLLRLVGYGRVDEEALYRSLDQTVTLIAEERITNDHHHFYEVPVPDAFWFRGRRSRILSVALAYSPEVRTTRLEYRATKLWFTLVAAADLDEVVAAFRRNREEGMGERNRNRWISNKQRKSGTLQVSRWTFRSPLRSDKRLFVVVTRQDLAWSQVSDQPENYALCVVLDDREQADARVNLYAEIRALLQARARIRLQA